MDHSKTAYANIGFECEFVEQPKELPFECPVCLFVLRDPCNTSCCDHSFCRGCIEQIKTGSNPFCPLCKQSFETHPHNWLQRALNQLEVYCTHKNDGCEWVGPLGQLDQHLNPDANTDNPTNGCGFVPIKCDACGENVPRKGYGVHMSSLCDQHPYSCVHCSDYNSTYLDVINNHWPQCPCHPVECTNKCGKHTKRKDLVQHLSNECPLTSTPCEFCSVQVLRGEMREHFVSNLTSHISSMVAEPFSVLSHQVGEANEMIHELRRNNRFLLDIEKLRLQVGKNKKEIHTIGEQNLETQGLYAEVRQYNDELMTDFEYLREDYEDLRDECEDLRQENKEFYAKIDRMSEDIKRLEFKGRASSKQQASSYQDYGHHRAAATTQSPRRNLSDLILDYKPSVSESDSSFVQDMQPSIPPIVLKMPNYSGYKSGLMGEYWVSKPFYSDIRPSYKLCLSAGVLKRDSVSVYVRLMRGEYNNELHWPFSANITIQLINHHDGRH